MTEFETLANAIIEQAAKDFRAAQKKLKKNLYNMTAQRTVREVEVFFLSDWFRALTTVSGPMILKMLKEECGV